MGQQIIKKVPFLFGGDYNPEQWPESTWENDIEMVERAGVNSATINVFSWSILQPRENEYNFSMLDKIVHLLSEHSFKIVLATSTAALPAWMVKKYPDVARVDTHGIRQKFGKRHNACPNSPNFRRLAKNLVDQIAKKYAKQKNVVCWHIANEYEGQCYCENCADAFRQWLKNKYMTLDKLNEAWNANFWSHTINEWDEIVPVSQLSDEFDNGKAVLGGESLDYRRFQSDSMLDNFLMEKRIIRQYDSKTPVTTNFMGTQKDLDYFKWAKHLDVVSWDNYPSFDTPASFTAMNHDLMYGLKKKPFMLMEQAPSQQNWQPYNSLKNPGEFRMLSYQAVAHGANTVQIFQLKQARSGCEKYHGSLISNRNSTDTRVFKEVSKVGNELKTIDSDIWKSKKKSKVAIIFDWESLWGLDSSVGPSIALHYIEQVHSYYKYFYRNNISVDLISENDEFSNYQLVIAPAHYILKNQFANRIGTFVRQGGKFVTNFMSNVVNENDNLFQGSAPLDKLLGIWIEEQDALTPKHDVLMQFKNDRSKVKANIICEIVHLKSAKCLAKFETSKFYNTYPAITVNDFGKGQAFYVGTSLDDDAMEKFAKYLMGHLKSNNIEENDAGVEVTTRYSNKYRYDFIINTENQVKIYHNSNSHLLDLLTNNELNVGDIKLNPYDVLITRINNND